MRARSLILLPALALAAPTVLAFREGGYFNDALHPVAPLTAAVLAWLLVAVVAVVAPVPLPRRAPGRVALAGIVLLAAWTGVSIGWAPVSGTATRQFEQALLYAAAFLVAVAALRSPGVQRRIEPALASGVAIVIGYALAARLLPGIIHTAHTQRAYGRLEQPLTYWNAEGALAGMGLVLCARLAGDPARSRRTRMLAAGVTPALAVGLWLVYSRGALAATGAGLVVLAAAAPTWSQLRSLAVTLVLAGAAIVPVTFFATISSAAGGARAERNGAIYLAVLLLLAGVGAAATREGIRRERSGRLATGRVPLPRGSTLLATIVVVAGAAALIYFASRERARPIRGGSAATAARLTNIDSNRYAYWKVAGRALGDHPLKGLGAGGFANAWIQQRPVRDPAVYAHSLELETGANLGIVGLLGLAGLLGGVGVAATRAQRLRPELVAGWSAATVVWLLHSSIDWDWEMPAVTLVALTLGGALVGVADGPGEPGGAPEPPARLTAHNLETARRARAPEDQPSS